MTEKLKLQVSILLSIVISFIIINKLNHDWDMCIENLEFHVNFDNVLSLKYIEKWFLKLFYHMTSPLFIG